MQDAKPPQPVKGFTLLETMIALVILMVGFLGMAAMLGDAIAYMQSSQSSFIAQQEAEAAMEAIFTAKYTDTITFAQIANTTSAPPGIFLSGPQPLLQPGADGLVGTAVDSVANPAYLVLPGPDGLMGTADDVDQPLTNFTRTIAISPSPCAAAGQTNITSVTVTINYTAGRFQRSYAMSSCISAYN